MKKDIFKVESILTNTNVTHNSISFSKKNNSLALASSNIIHIYSLQDNTIHLGLKHHKRRVNEVKWVDSENSSQIVSIGSDGKVVFFKNDSNSTFDHWKWVVQGEIFSEKEVSINCFDYIKVNSHESYLVFFDEKMNLTGYFIKDKEMILEKTMIFSQKLKNIPVSISLSLLSNSHLLVLLGGYDSKVNIYTTTRQNQNQNEKETLLQFHLSLQGHLNSIKDISIDDEFSPSFIASSSQDTYVRLWSIKKLSQNETFILKTRSKQSISVFDEYAFQTSYTFNTSSSDYYHILLESILSDHEDSVSSVRFMKCKDDSLKILTSSMDFTVGIWGYKNVSKLIIIYVSYVFLYYLINKLTQTKHNTSYYFSIQQLNPLYSLPFPFLRTFGKKKQH